MVTLADTEVFVAPHGAGLTNMIFLPDNGKVVEILNHPNYYNAVYSDLALNLGLVYRGISPLTTSPTTVDYSRADPAHVTRVVSNVIGGGGS